MTGGGGDFNQHMRHLQRSPDPLAGFEGLEGEHGRKEKEDEGGKDVEGWEKEREGKKKGRGKRMGKGRDRWYPTFWYKLTPMSARNILKRRIGLATRNQSALFMMSINMILC